MQIDWLLGEDLWAWGCGNSSPHVRLACGNSRTHLHNNAYCHAAPARLRACFAASAVALQVIVTTLHLLHKHLCKCSSLALPLQVWYGKGHCFHACFSDLLLLAGRSALVICGLAWWLRELQYERSQARPAAQQLSAICSSKG